MYFKFLLFLLFANLLLLQNAFAYDNDSNILISESAEHYEFFKTKGNVAVKEDLSTTYYCNNYRTVIPVVEMYNNETTVDNVNADVDGKRMKDLKPVYEYYEVDDYFFSDQKVCFFQLPLEKQGSRSSVNFEKTITDARYFTVVYFSKQYAIGKKQVTFTVPRWVKAELKEMNFKNYDIKKTVVYDSKDDADVYTYTINNLPANENESNSPGPSYVNPHILILLKQATIDNGTKNYFNTVADQYAWYREIIGSLQNDENILKTKAQEITAGIISDTGKIKAVLYWVQNNIRYIAFEDGIAGFKPDKADEVLRKKYGDCKGMANLTKCLLKSLGYDARLCWIGTKHIAYDYSTPSLSVDNHMICALKYQGKLYFLDATETYLSFNDYAERIQGRQVLVEDGDKYILTNIPSPTFEQNLDDEKRHLTISGTDLKGNAIHEWKGEDQEYILSELNSLKKDKMNDAFTKYLSNDDKNYVLEDFKTSDISNYDKPLNATYTITHKNAVSSFDKDYYVDLDFDKEFSTFIFDTTKRKLDYWFSHKTNISRETELTIPEGFTLTSIPDNLDINTNNYEFKITYTKQPNKLIYKKTIIIKNTWLKKTDFSKWNEDVQKLAATYNEQITLTAK